MNNNVKVEFTDLGMESIEEAVDKTYAWMGDENTIGDCLITLADELFEQWLGEDILSMSMAKFEHDRESRMKVLKRLAESPMWDVFVKAGTAEQLEKLMI